MDTKNIPDHPQQGEPWDEKMAHWYVTHYGEHPVNEVAVVAAALVGTETVLDVGCGGGAAIRAAASRLTTGKAIGIDPSPTMVEISKTGSSSKDISFMEGGAEALPLLDKSVNVVLAVNSLHHWSNIEKGLGEIARVLRKSGRLIIVEEIFEEAARGMDSHEVKGVLEKAMFTVSAVTLHEFEDARAHVFLAERSGVKVSV